jgi:hypothetical protein
MLENRTWSAPQSERGNSMAGRCQSIMNVRGKGQTHILIERDATIAPAKSPPQQSHHHKSLTQIPTIVAHK